MICRIGEEEHKSEVCKNGGVAPHWNDTFSFSSKEAIMRIQLYDKDKIGKDDLIGEGTCNLGKIYKSPNSTQNGKHESMQSMWMSYLLRMKVKADAFSQSSIKEKPPMWEDSERSPMREI